MKNIIKVIGNTPMIEITSFHNNPEVKIYAKMEGNNPGGSVKDRAALYMIKSAIERHELDEGKTIIEATSGNTGIALAMIASMFNVSIELILPETSTKERILTMQAFGAKVILKESIEVCRDYAEEKGNLSSYFLLNQFANPDNYRAHFETTGPEIWNDTKGSITHFVSAMGTTGTIMGCSRYLKSKNTDIQIIGCQPTEDSSIPGIRRWPKAYLPKIFDPDRVDKTLDISQLDAVERTRQLASKEGLFVGMSSGGAFHAALKIANKLEKGVVVFITCDRGDRYLSSDLFSRPN